MFINIKRVLILYCTIISNKQGKIGNLEFLITKLFVTWRVITYVLKIV